MSSEIRGTTVVSLLSPKGGSGKTVLSLALASLLSQVGRRVLLVDCDFATHGLTHFFIPLSEPAVVATPVMSYLSGTANASEVHLFEASTNLHFSPSVQWGVGTGRRRELSARTQKQRLNHFLKRALEACPCDLVVLDCQAGYSSLNEAIASLSNVRIVVLEYDAVTMSALGDLASNLGKALQPTATWQVFNKVTIEELDLVRNTASTFFPTLPGLPFDWGIRGSFALGTIPQFIRRDEARTEQKKLAEQSMFGLGALRIARKLFPTLGASFDSLERKAGIVDWYSTIGDLFESLSQKSEERMKERRQRRSRWRKTFALIATSMMVVLILADLLLVVLPLEPTLHLPISGLVMAILFPIILGSFGLSWWMNGYLDRDVADDNEERESRAEWARQEGARVLYGTDPRSASQVASNKHDSPRG